MTKRRIPTLVTFRGLFVGAGLTVIAVSAFDPRSTIWWTAVGAFLILLGLVRPYVPFTLTRVRNE